jgi:MYXO-CTERM domain-containing protein
MKSQVFVSALALFAAVAVPVVLPLAVPVGAQPTTVTIALAEENGSGQSGTAMLSAEGDQTRVVIDLANSPAGPQPAHIHTGNCGPTLGGVVFALEFPRDGKSTSLVNTPLAAVQTGGFAINVHKSPQEANIYVACGNIPAVAGAAQPSGESQPKPAATATTAAPAAAQPKPAVTATTAAPAAAQIPAPKPTTASAPVAPKPVASPAVQIPAALPRTGDGSTIMSFIPAVAGALGAVGVGLGLAARRRR